MTLLKNLSRAALIASLSAFAVPAMVSAQDAGDEPAATSCEGRGGHHGRRGHHGRHHARLLEQLELSENQQAQIEAIRASAREARGENRGDRAARHAAHEEMRRLVNDVLTPAQRTQLETLKAAHRAERMNHRIERMTERLSLTEAQVTRITAIFESAHTERETTLERMQGEERHEAHRALRESTRRAVDAVLTPEQREIVEAMHARRGERRARQGRRGGRGR